MKHAILITAYKNFEHLLDLVTFFDERFEIFIHIDKKSKLNKYDLYNIKLVKNVKLVSRRYKVNWGGRNHLKSILHLAKVALDNKDLTIFHLITGQDYPVKPLDYYINFFDAHPKDNFLSCNELPFKNWEDGGLSRLEYYHLYDVLNAKKYRKYLRKLINIQKWLGIKRRITKLIPKLYGGETYWTLSREALTYVIDYTDKNIYFLRRLQYTYCAEEIYFQTVLMNSEYAPKVINDSLRYIDWKGRNGNLPANLDFSDLEKIRQSNCLFARKFEFPVSTKLKEQLIMDINNK